MEIEVYIDNKKLRIESLLNHPITQKCWYGYYTDELGNKRYVITEGIARIAENDEFYTSWIHSKDKNLNKFQDEKTVSFFDFEWNLFPYVNNSDELYFRAFDRYQIEEKDIKGKLLLDAGCGAGTLSEFFIKKGANVVSLDLSNAINIAAKKLYSYKNWNGFKADITKMPFPDNYFDYVHCEGVIQHTHNSFEAVKELVRVTKVGGHIAAWHYTKPKKQSFFNKFFSNLREKRRNKFKFWDKHVFIAYTAFLTSLGYIPIIGDLLKRAKFISKKSLNKSFQANWAMTMDALGWHEYQRFITKDEFKDYFLKCGKFKTVYEDPHHAIVHFIKL